MTFHSLFINIQNYLNLNELCPRPHLQSISYWIKYDIYKNIDPAFFSCFSHCCRRLNHNNSSQQQCWECRLQHKTPWHTTHSDHVVILFRDEKLEEGNHVFLICINHGYKSNSSRKCHQKYHRVTWLDIIVCNKVLKWRVRWSSEWSRSRSFPPGKSRLP